MADTMTVSGGVRTNVQTLVSADQITITGDGTTENPLRATGGTISVVTDDTTILGNGTTEDPLRAFPPVIAAAGVNSNGIYIEQFGFTGTIGTPATGEYQLTIANPPPLGANALVVMIAIAGSVGGQASYLFDSNSVVHVYIFDKTGTPVAGIFSISILSVDQT
jgi:hypothetical protein